MLPQGQNLRQVSLAALALDITHILGDQELYALCPRGLGFMLQALVLFASSEELDVIGPIGFRRRPHFL